MQVVVKATHGGIEIHSDSPMLAEVYNTSGQLLYNGYDKLIPITAHGLYIVHVGDTVHKVVL